MILCSVWRCRRRRHCRRRRPYDDDIYSTSCSALLLLHIIIITCIHTNRLWNKEEKEERAPKLFMNNWEFTAAAAATRRSWVEKVFIGDWNKDFKQTGQAAAAAAQRLLWSPPLPLPPMFSFFLFPFYFILLFLWNKRKRDERTTLNFKKEQEEEEEEENRLLLRVDRWTGLCVYVFFKLWLSLISQWQQAQQTILIQLTNNK